MCQHFRPGIHTLIARWINHATSSAVWSANVNPPDKERMRRGFEQELRGIPG